MSFMNVLLRITMFKTLNEAFLVYETPNDTKIVSIYLSAIIISSSIFDPHLPTRRTHNILFGVF